MERVKTVYEVKLQECKIKHKKEIEDLQKFYSDWEKFAQKEKTVYEVKLQEYKMKYKKEIEDLRKSYSN